MASALFSPITLRGLTIPNRIAVSPMCQYQADDGTPNDWHLMHLGSFSLGAAGLIMAEMTDVTAQGRISKKCAGLYSDDNEKGWKRVVDFCRTFGVAKIGIQIGHAGRKASTHLPAAGGAALKPEEGAWESIAPSPIPFVPDWPKPREMTKDDIKKTIADFVAAVNRAERAGFDMIEMHGGHGYLVHQFLSPLSNQRKDEYGGSLENRMRFPLELFDAMRAAWPKDKPMSARISAVDWVEGGTTIEDTIVLAKELKKRGLDIMDVSSGQVDIRQQIPFAPNFNVQFAERIKKETGLPVMSVGLITKAQDAEDVIASGKADMVALGRGVMYDPRWAWHAAEELGAETAYAPKMMACHPKMRPMIFTNRKQA